MQQYKASDLVSAAIKLADLENSSFITSTENRMYINNAWDKLYQKAIDYGETFYLKSTEVSEGENNLPEDFHQLYDIYETSTNRRIKRFNKNLNHKSDRYYRIIGDKIYINHVDNPVTLEYFPAPATLDIEGTGDVTLDYPSNIYKQLMVLYLAEYYKVRQGGDISGIELMISNAENQFYDMLTRDDNEPSVITDVYEVKRFSFI